MGFQFQSVVGVSSFLRADLGIGLGDLGIMIGAYMLPGIVVAMPGGAIGRRFGEKRVAIVGLLHGPSCSTFAPWARRTRPTRFSNASGPATTCGTGSVARAQALRRSHPAATSAR